MPDDALQDMLRDPDGLKELYVKMNQTSAKSKMDLFEEYLRKVDVHLVEMGMGFRPAKSIEFGKMDQSMLNHIRNGILFLLRFNAALGELEVLPLNERDLRDCIALFAVHDIHKLELGEFLGDEDRIETRGTMESEFEISERFIKTFVDIVDLRNFAPKLRIEDYHSAAVSLHKSKFSRPGGRTSRFMDLEPFLYLMDNMSSCASPEEAVSSRSLKALRDGFPQDSLEFQLNLQYHRLDDVKGILSGIINKSVADVMQEKGQVMLMAYQDGCVYLSRGTERAKISDKMIERIYDTLVENIQDLPALSDPDKLNKKLKTPRLGYYGLSDEYYFFSGPKAMLRSFIDTSVTFAHAEGSRKLTDSIIEGIIRADEIVPVELERSEQGQKILVGFARAVATVHQSFISEMISDNKYALSKTCDIWNVPEDVKNALLASMETDPNRLSSGGKWDYAYAIGQCVMDQVHDGVKLRNMGATESINYLVDLIWEKLNEMDEWDDFVSGKTDLYRRELMEYLHEVLSINGTISHLERSSLSDSFKEYGMSGKICNLCNRGTLLNKNEMKNSNSFLSYNFTNRVFVGKTKPDNIYTCIPCGIELALRKNGFDMPKGRAANNELLYFHIIPDYFFTPESWELVHTILLKFDDSARVRMAALAKKIFNSIYVGKSPDTEGDFDVHENWIKDLAVEEGDDGSKGMDMTQYTAQGYENLIGNAAIAFYKPSENNTEFHFFGIYIALIIAAYTGMRVVVSPSPIPSIRARDFKEVAALDSVNSHVANFYGKFISLSNLEKTLKSASALIRLGYNTKSGLKDSLFPKYLRVVRDEVLPGSYLLKMAYRGQEGESNIGSLLDEALFLDEFAPR